MNASSFMESEFVFPKEFEYYCFKNCYWNLLKYYGVESPELFLDCGIEWLFTEDGSDKYGYSFSTGDFSPAFCLLGLGKHISTLIQITSINVRKFGSPIV